MVNDKYDLFIVIPLTIIALLAAMTLRKAIILRDQMKEAEVKYHCHKIQVALAKYALYNDGCYPAYLFGGETDGWDPTNERACQAMLQLDEKLPPTDPLIDEGYLSAYPNNPFVDPGNGKSTIIFWTSYTQEPGYGDPRFGYDGESMGNCLNNPLNLWSGPGELTNFANTFIYREIEPDYHLGMVRPWPINPYYSKGGIPEWSRNSENRYTNEGLLNYFWSGQFFYRAGGPPSNLTNIKKGTPSYIWDYRPEYYDRYLLGGYGSPRTKGIDCIRLTDKDGYTANNTEGYLDDFYEINTDYCWKVHLSTPEVFGGGERGKLPTFPYYDEQQNWVYGAPDGYPDGIIILLVPGDVYDDFTEKVTTE
jgi:hypothetical protein